MKGSTYVLVAGQGIRARIGRLHLHLSNASHLARRVVARDYVEHRRRSPGSFVLSHLAGVKKWVKAYAQVSSQEIHYRYRELRYLPI